MNLELKKSLSCYITFSCHFLLNQTFCSGGFMTVFHASDLAQSQHLCCLVLALYWASVCSLGCVMSVVVSHSWMLTLCILSAPFAHLQYQLLLNVRLVKSGLFVCPHGAQTNDNLLCQLMLAKCNRHLIEHCMTVMTVLWHSWLGGRKGIRPVHNMGGWWRWALVSPDGVAFSRMISVSASSNLPLHHKVRKFSSCTGSPGWSQKKGRKTVVVCMTVMSETCGSFVWLIK